MLDTITCMGPSINYVTLYGCHALGWGVGSEKNVTIWNRGEGGLVMSDVTLAMCYERGVKQYSRKRDILGLTYGSD